MRRRARGMMVLVAFALLSTGAIAPESTYDQVLINEIAWAGAGWNARAEWIELFNPSSEPVRLDGWRLVSSDGCPDIVLRGTISGHVRGEPSTGFFLLERGTDGAVPEVDADLIYVGALTDRGETLYLYDPRGHLVDTANAPTPGPWPAGTEAHGTPPCASMERLDYRLPDAKEAWATSTVAVCRGSPDRPVRGTPREENATFNVPPLPSFEVTPRIPPPGASVAFDASGSTDENDRVASYRWEFGDGTAGMGVSVTHTYEQPGDYRVVLVLTDEKGGRSELARTVRVQVMSPPLADFSVVFAIDDPVPRAGNPVRFHDESSDVDGEIAAREWRFGDGGAATDVDPNHTYDDAGTYVISLQVTDDHGNTALQTDSVTIASRLPAAQFTRTPEFPHAGEVVRFDASSSHDPDGHVQLFCWDFDGDRAYETETGEPIVEYAFPRCGDHAVRLLVVDDFGDRSDPFCEAVSVNCPPVAAFRLSAFESAELAPIRFTDLSYDSDGTIAQRLWDFGDGICSDEMDPDHAFEQDGTFLVALTVTDDRGAQRTTSAAVVIRNLPPIAALTSEPPIRPTGSAFPLDASGSSDPSPRGSIAQFEWDLDGDGTFERTSTSPTLSHAYPDDGSYVVRVRVTDDDGESTVSEPLSLRVTNRPPRIDRITWTPHSPSDADEVRFAGTASDPDGDIAQWFWDLSEEIIVVGSGPTVRFPDDGIHTLWVTVEDNDGARSEPFAVDVSVGNAPPVAAFTVASTEDLCARFDARSSYDPSPTGRVQHVAWDFGDGTTCPGGPDGCAAPDRNAPLHCYSAPGTYIVALVVIDEQGVLSRATKTIFVGE